MPNPIENLSSEKRMLLAIALCIIVSVLFARMSEPPKRPDADSPGVERDLLKGPGASMVSGSPGSATGEIGSATGLALDAAIRPATAPIESTTQAPPPAHPEALARGPLAQSSPPEVGSVTLDTPTVRMVFSTQGACLTSVRLKTYRELDPPLEILEAQVMDARTLEGKAFWQQRLEEARARIAQLDTSELKRDPPYPEEAWVELVPPYTDAVGRPLRLTFEAGGTDEGLVYTVDRDSLTVEEGVPAQIRFTATTDSGFTFHKTVGVGGEHPGFDVTVDFESQGGVAQLRETFGELWALEWPDGLGHLPFTFHGNQEGNYLYSLRNDSKENSPTQRSWLVDQAQDIIPTVSRDFLDREGDEVFVSEYGHAFDRLDGKLNYRHALDGRVGWINVETRYFIATFLPPQDPPMEGLYMANAIRTRLQADTRVGMGVISEFTGNPRTVHVYVGPKLTGVLSQLGYGLERVVYDSWFGQVCLLVEWLLGVFYWLIPSYGVAIILLCIFSKIVLYPLSYKQAQMQKKMGELQPKIAELKEKYKDDQQKQSQEMMKLWKKHGVNPMSGCLPMLAQLPIFIALYRTVQSSIDLRGASFLWIDDLSLPDMTFFLPFSLPYIGNAVNVLPFVMMAISFIQMQQQKKYMPDPSQAQVMTIMTLMFPFILYHFQSGLVLYWTANSLTQWIQQKAMEHMGHAAPRGGQTAGASSNGDEEEEPEDEGPAPGPKRPVPPPRPKPRRKRAAK